MNAGVLSRAQGCLLGQLAGDSLGGLVEFQSAESIARRYPVGVRLLAEGGAWGILAGQPTDDSELALALARSLADRGTFDEQAVATAYARWYLSEPFDIGGTTATALSAAACALEGGGDPAAAARQAADPSSQANGALMRVSPLGVFGWRTDRDLLAAWARRDARLTHPHEVCADASALLACTIAEGIVTGCHPAELFSFAQTFAGAAGLCPQIRETLERARSQPPRDYTHHAGWVIIALQNAFYRLAHASSLEEGVVDTVMAGGDTDTNACIAGALLGAAHGAEAVPQQWVEAILSCRPEAGAPGVRRPRPREYWPVDALELAARLVAGAGERACGTLHPH